MLEKEFAVPGARVVLKDILKDGVPGNMSPDNNHVIPYITIAREIGSYMLTGGWKVGSGTELEIIKKPRRKNGINSIRVKVVDQPEIEGEVYWCELRASARISS